MTDLVEETKLGASKSEIIEYVVYYFFGAIEILLMFRFVLRLAGANNNSAFVNMIYGLTNIFTWPFESIFRRTVAPGFETMSVFEPATLTAVVVYAIISWGIVKLVRITSGEKQD